MRIPCFQVLLVSDKGKTMYIFIAVKQNSIGGSKKGTSVQEESVSHTVARLFGKKIEEGYPF